MECGAVNTKGASSEGMKCNGVKEPESSVWFKVRGTGHRLLASTCNPGKKERESA